MRYASIRTLDISNGIGVGASLFLQGCPFHCHNCFNPETWDFNGGKEFTSNTRNEVLRTIKPDYITRWSLLGGEPLVSQNMSELAKLIQLIRKTKPDIQIWVYTGYTLEELQKREGVYTQYILDNIDVLVDGQYIDELRDVSLPFCGSRNQRIIDMNKTKKQGKIVLLDV